MARHTEASGRRTRRAARRAPSRPRTRPGRARAATRARSRRSCPRTARAVARRSRPASDLHGKRSGHDQVTAPRWGVPQTADRRRRGLRRRPRSRRSAWRGRGRPRPASARCRTSPTGPTRTSRAALQPAQARRTPPGPSPRPDRCARRRDAGRHERQRPPPLAGPPASTSVPVSAIATVQPVTTPSSASSSLALSPWSSTAFRGRQAAGRTRRNADPRRLPKLLEHTAQIVLDARAIVDQPVAQQREAGGVVRACLPCGRSATAGEGARTAPDRGARPREDLVTRRAHGSTTRGGLLRQRPKVRAPRSTGRSAPGDAAQGVRRPGQGAARVHRAGRAANTRASARIAARSAKLGLAAT